MNTLITALMIYSVAGFLHVLYIVTHRERHSFRDAWCQWHLAIACVLSYLAFFLYAHRG